MKNIFFYLLLTILYSQSSFCFAIPQFQAKYNGYKGGIKIGNAEIKLTKNAMNIYHFDFEIRPGGLFSLFRKHKVTESSFFKIINQQISPIEYNFHYSSGKRQKKERIIFDHTKHRVANIIGEQWELPLSPGLLDYGSVRMALLNDLILQKKTLNYQVADENRIKQYHFIVTGKEQLKTSIGVFDTLIIERKHQQRKTIFWMAKKLNFIAVKASQFKKNKHLFTIKIKSYQILDKS